METHADLACQRNDLYGEWMILLLQAGRFDEAAERITARQYDVYEGGEGRMVRVYEWIHILRGLTLLEAGEPEQALVDILRARTVPACFHEGREQDAEALFREMDRVGAALVEKGGRYDHFATGVPTPAPFEGDRARRNQSEGFLLVALAQAGLADPLAARNRLDAVLALQANHLSAWIHAGKCGVTVLNR